MEIEGEKFCRSFDVELLIDFDKYGSIGGYENFKFNCNIMNKKILIYKTFNQNKNLFVNNYLSDQDKV